MKPYYEELSKCTYSPPGKALEKQAKTIEDRGEKQVDAIERHRKHLVKFNAPIKGYSYDAQKASLFVIEQNKYLMNLLIKNTRSCY